MKVENLDIIKEFHPDGFDSNADYHEYEITTGEFRFIGSTFVDEPDRITFGGIYFNGEMGKLGEVDFSQRDLAGVITYLKSEGIMIMDLRYEEETQLKDVLA